MIKFYKNMTDYAKQNGIHRNTASKRFKAWELDLIEIPKGAKWIDRKYISNIDRDVNIIIEDDKEMEFEIDNYIIYGMVRDSFKLLNERLYDTWVILWPLTYDTWLNCIDMTIRKLEHRGAVKVLTKWKILKNILYQNSLKQLKQD